MYLSSLKTLLIFVFVFSLLHVACSPGDDTVQPTVLDTNSEPEKIAPNNPDKRNNKVKGTPEEPIKLIRFSDKLLPRTLYDQGPDDFENVKKSFHECFSGNEITIFNSGTRGREERIGEPPPGYPYYWHVGHSTLYVFQKENERMSLRVSIYWYTDISLLAKNINAGVTGGWLEETNEVKGCDKCYRNIYMYGHRTCIFSHENVLVQLMSGGPYVTEKQEMNAAKMVNDAYICIKRALDDFYKKKEHKDKEDKNKKSDGKKKDGGK